MTGLFREEVRRHGRARVEGAPLRFASVLRGPLILVSITFLLLALGIAVLLPVPRTASLQGTVVSDKGLIRLTGPEGALVAEVFVEEGQTVAAGARVARIERLRGDGEGFPGESVAVANDARRQSLGLQGESERAARLAESAQTRSALNGKIVALDQIREQSRLAGQRESLATATVERAQELMDRGFLTRLELDNRRYNLLSEQSAISALAREQAELEAGIAADRARLQQLAAEDLAASQAQRGALAALSIEALRTNQDAGYYITAPRQGRMLLVNYHAGQEVRAGTPVALMEPPSLRPTVEFYAQPRDAVRMAVGQTVRVRFDAFPTNRHPPVKGLVVSISPVVRSPEEIVAPGLEFTDPMMRILVRLSATETARDNRLVIRPGLVARGKVVMERRSVLDHVFGLDRPAGTEVSR